MHTKVEYTLADLRPKNLDSRQFILFCFAFNFVFVFFSLQNLGLRLLPPLPPTSHPKEFSIWLYEIFSFHIIITNNKTISQTEEKEQWK